MLKDFSIGVIKYRAPLLIAIIILTTFFAWHAFHIEFITDFNDLLPRHHPYVKIHKKYRDRFGGANITTIVLEVKEGDIYNMKTLQKIQNINKAMYYIPNINNLQVTSLADRKVKNIVSDAQGLYRSAVMWPNLPKNEQEIQKLKDTILGNPNIYGQFVSLNNKMLLLYADFWEKAIDYRAIFQKLQDIVAKESDENHIIHMAGEPVLYGWVYSYFPQTMKIFGSTMLIVLVLLFAFIRTIRGMVLPVLGCLMNAAWGLGMAHLLGYHLDPLIVVVPVLLCVMALSHGVMMVMRFENEAPKIGDSKVAAEKCLFHLFTPGSFAIVADIAGLSIMLLCDYPLIQHVAVWGTFWAMTFLVSMFVLIPIILSYLPVPKVKERQYALFGTVLRHLGYSFMGKGKYVIIGIAAVLYIWGVENSRFLTIGDPRPGTPILWPDSTYNKDVAVIDSNFPGTNQMYIVFDAKDEFKAKGGIMGEPVCKRPNVLRKFNDFQRYLERIPEIGITLSLADLIPGLNMKLMADNPRWEQLPISRDHSGELFQMLMAGSDPGDLDRFTNFDYTEASVIMYFKNRTGDTLRKVIAKSKEWIADPKNQLEEGEFKLAGGVVAVLSAVNEIIVEEQARSIILALVFVFCWATFAYRSFIAGFLLVLPLLVCKQLTFSYMAFKGMGLNISVLPVASIGIGMGVEYAIYIMSRIKDEYRATNDWKEAVGTAMETAGLAVVFTAGTLVLGVVFWYFFSNLRFQAEMGLMMSLWFALASLAGMILVPCLATLIKPKFLTKGKGFMDVSH